MNDTQKLKVPEATNNKIDKAREELNQKSKEGKLTTEDMFKLIDEDGSGKIGKHEFAGFAKRMGMSLSEHRINEIFANVKKQSKNSKSKDDGELDLKEFTMAYSYLQNQNTSQALDKCGMSLPKLTSKLIGLAFMLLLVFIFIFFGINAFSIGGSFGAVVNSVLPISGGTGAAKSTVNEFAEMPEEKLNQLVEKIQTILTSTKL